MFEILDRQKRLTGNQIKILAAAIIGDALEFFDYLAASPSTTARTARAPTA